MTSNNPFGFEDYTASIVNFDLMPLVNEDTIAQYQKDAQVITRNSISSAAGIPNSQSYEQSPFPDKTNPQTDELSLSTPITSMDAFLNESPVDPSNSGDNPAALPSAEQFRALVTADLAPQGGHTFSWWSDQTPAHKKRYPGLSSDDIEFSPRSLDGGNLNSPFSLADRYSSATTPDIAIPPPPSASRRGNNLFSKFKGLFERSNSPSPPVSPRESIPSRLSISLLSPSPSSPHAMILSQEASHALAKRLSRQPVNAVTWKEQVLPTWPQYRGTSRLRSLCRDGIPASLRGEAWLNMVGNDMGVEEEDWLAAGERAARYESDALKLRYGRQVCGNEYGYVSFKSNTPAAAAASKPNHNIGMSVGAIGTMGKLGGEHLEKPISENRLASTQLIRTDLARTFPDLGLFSQDKPLGFSLLEVLMAFAHHRPEMGYTQGMSFFVALFLLYMSPSSAFQCFVNLSSLDLHSAFFAHDMPKVNVYFEALDYCFAQTQPRLHRAVVALSVEPSMYAYEWLQCAFAKTLPLTALLRVWDIYMEAISSGQPHSGSGTSRNSTVSVAVLFRCALALLRIAEESVIPAMLCDRRLRRERRNELQDAAAMANMATRTDAMETTDEMMLKTANGEGAAHITTSSTPVKGGAGAGAGAGARGATSSLPPLPLASARHTPHANTPHRGPGAGPVSGDGGIVGGAVEEEQKAVGGQVDCAGVDARVCDTSTASAGCVDDQSSSLANAMSSLKLNDGGTHTSEHHATTSTSAPISTNTSTFTPSRLGRSSPLSTASTTASTTAATPSSRTREHDGTKSGAGRYDWITADTIFEDDGCGEDEITFEMLVNVLSKPFTVNEDELVVVMERVPLSDRAITRVIEEKINKLKNSNGNQGNKQKN